MRYRELVESVRNFEDSFWFGEYVYFKAIEKLEDIRVDISRVDAKEHLEKIIKMFLTQWGRMGRTVDREDLNWGQLARQLRNSKETFQTLQNKSLLDINLKDEETANAIKNAYDAARVRYIGPTAISKILHLLNPGLFVMWDDEIRRKYKVSGSVEGYLKFLRLMREEVEEALNEEATKRGCNKTKIVEEICRELPSKKLGQEYNRKTIAKLVDEYNWWAVYYGV